MTPGFTEWYQENREELLAKRRKKYRDDKEYRERQKDRSAAYRKKHRTKKDKKRSGSFVRVLVCRGRVELVWSFSVLAKRLGSCVKTCDGWQRRELLPESPIRINRTRYYTEHMIRSAVGLYTDGPSKEKAKKLHSIWKASFRSLGWRGATKELDEVRLNVAPGFAVSGIGVFADKIGKTVDTIWKWHDDKWLPEPPKLGGRPVYTDKMMDVVIRHASGDRVKREWLEHEDIKKVWGREKALLSGRAGDKDG